MPAYRVVHLVLLPKTAQLRFDCNVSLSRARFTIDVVLLELDAGSALGHDALRYVPFIHMCNRQKAVGQRGSGLIMACHRSGVVWYQGEANGFVKTDTIAQSTDESDDN
jgi:hypothetical protein